MSCRVRLSPPAYRHGLPAHPGNIGETWWLSGRRIRSACSQPWVLVLWVELCAHLHSWCRVGLDLRKVIKKNKEKLGRKWTSGCPVHGFFLTRRLILCLPGFFSGLGAGFWARSREEGRSLEKKKRQIISPRTVAFSGEGVIISLKLHLFVYLCMCLLTQGTALSVEVRGQCVEVHSMMYVLGTEPSFFRFGN